MHAMVKIDMQRLHLFNSLFSKNIKCTFKKPKNIQCCRFAISEKWHVCQLLFLHPESH